MELITKLWKNFKVQPEIWFFYGFLLTFTLTIRKVLWFLPLRGEFNEYSGIYLYLSDIFLVLTLMAWTYTILYNKYSILSILKNVPGKTLVLPLALVIWSFISLIWAENKIVSIFRLVKILEFYLLYIFVAVRLFYWNINNNVPSQKECSTWNILRDKRGTLLKKIFGLIMIIGLFQAIIGIIQFLLQHSIGLFWLRESLISPDIAGVAKVIFNGEAFVRAYGLFPHPNILGGFLLFSILISLLYYRMFHACHVAKKCSTWNISFATGVEHFKNLRGGTILFKLILGIQLLALILTFSKSSILGLILGLIWYVYANVPRPPRLAETAYRREAGGTFIDFLIKKKKLVIVASLIIIFTFILAKPDLYSFLFKGLNERLVYADVSRGTILDNPILGIGFGQFVISMQNLSIIRENWMLQPVHNVFLLVWSELGLIGLLVLLLAIGFILKGMFHPRSKEIVPRGTISCYGASVKQSQSLSGNSLVNVKNTFGAIFVGLLFIMFFDHYLWDIQQGNFLLWMTMGFLIGAGKCKNTI